MKQELKKDAPIAQRLEADSNDVAWEYYRQFPRIEFDEDALKLRGKSRKRKILNAYKIKDSMGKWNQWEIPLGGDCFFNFNDTKCGMFQDIMKAEKGAQEELNSLLEICKENHHSVENFVLLPVTGGLNNAKQSCYYSVSEETFVFAGVGRPAAQYDRGDTFIYMLEQFYTFRKQAVRVSEGSDTPRKPLILDVGEFLTNSVFKWSLQTRNFAPLFGFLNSFEDIYDFCGVLFDMDRDWVGAMISSGQQPIKDGKSMKAYMEFCISYWEAKREPTMGSGTGK